MEKDINQYIGYIEEFISEADSCGIAISTILNNTETLIDLDYTNMLSMERREDNTVLCMGSRQILISDKDMDCIIIESSDESEIAVIKILLNNGITYEFTNTDLLPK